MPTRLEPDLRQAFKAIMSNRKKAGGRPGVTLQQVREASERLARSGYRVSIVNIRYELGTGSYSTLQRHLRTLELEDAETLQKVLSRTGKERS